MIAINTIAMVARIAYVNCHIFIIGDSFGEKNQGDL